MTKLFWVTTLAAMFFAAWQYLPVASKLHRFSYAWAIAFGAAAGIKLVGVIVVRLRRRTDKKSTQAAGQSLFP